MTKSTNWTLWTYFNMSVLFIYSFYLIVHSFFFYFKYSFIYYLFSFIYYYNYYVLSCIIIVYNIYWVWEVEAVSIGLMTPFIIG